MADIDRHAPDPDIKRRDAPTKLIEQQTPNPEANPGPDVAGEAHGDLAADAAAQLERSGYTLQGVCGDPQEIERQAACLIAWAQKRGCS